MTISWETIEMSKCDNSCVRTCHYVDILPVKSVNCIINSLFSFTTFSRVFILLQKNIHEEFIIAVHFPPVSRWHGTLLRAEEIPEPPASSSGHQFDEFAVKVNLNIYNIHRCMYISPLMIKDWPRIKVLRFYWPSHRSPLSNACVKFSVAASTAVKTRVHR